MQYHYQTSNSCLLCDFELYAFSPHICIREATNQYNPEYNSEGSYKGWSISIFFLLSLGNIMPGLDGVQN